MTIPVAVLWPVFPGSRGVECMPMVMTFLLVSSDEYTKP